MKCPKCTYERSEIDRLTDPKVCPNCGIYYHKWQSREERKALAYSRRQSNSNILKNNEMLKNQTIILILG